MNFEYLDKKFNKVDERFDGLSEIFVTLEEAVTKKDFEELKSDFRNLQTLVDTYAHKADKFFEELVMLSHKVDRPEKWLRQIAEKLDIKLEF